MRPISAQTIPAVDEAGLPGLYGGNWTAFWMPKCTPKDVIAKLNGAVVAALADTNIRARLADLGQKITPRERQTPEALGAFQRAEIERSAGRSSRPPTSRACEKGLAAPHCSWMSSSCASARQ